MRHRFEEVYDNEIAPLMGRIIEIAKREEMPFFAAVSCGLAENGDELTCETMILPEQDGCPTPGIRNRIGLCHGIMRGHSGFDRAAGLMISRFHPEKPR